MDIIPAILTDSKDELARELDLFSPHFPRIQIDVADGILVEGTTIPLDQILTILQAHPTKLEFDFHLMVSDYRTALDVLEHISNIVVNTMLIHLSALKNNALPHTLRGTIGIVLNPDESVEDLSHVCDIALLRAVQIMTVAPGAQGREFMKEALTKIDDLRSRNFTGPIFVDGGVNDQSMKNIVSRSMLPDYVCVGSYFSSATDDTIADKIKTIKQITNPEAF